MVDTPSAGGPPPADEEDDDMADLFSFGSSELSAGDASPNTSMLSQPQQSSPADVVSTPTADQETETLRSSSADSEDSFSNLLDSAVLGTSTVVLGPASGTGAHDAETEEILNWLNEEDEDDTTANEHVESMVFGGVDGATMVALPPKDDKPSTESSTASTKDTTTAAPATAEPTVVAMPPPEPTVVALPPEFDSLEQALRSEDASVSQIRALFQKQSGAVILESLPQLRAELWCRLLNSGKSVEATENSSLADSLKQWTAPEGGEDNKDVAWIRQQAQQLAARVEVSTSSTDGNDSDAPVVNAADLERMLLYHYYQQLEQQQKSASSVENGEQEGASSSSTPPIRDPLLPTVACTLLSASLPVTVANLLFAQHLIPHHMPLLALRPDERWEAALTLHSNLYLLACYHVPLLVYHLDRHLPGWYWPRIPTSAIESSDGDQKKENEEEQRSSVTARVRDIQHQGQLPPSWLLCYMAGEAEGSVVLPLPVVQKLWDGIFALPDKNTSKRFFLTLAVLEQSASDLMLLTGPALVEELQKVLSLKEKDALGWVEEWWKRAEELQASTPDSVVDKLNKVEDEAIQQALQRRQELAEAELQARLDRQAEAHRLAQEQKAEQARERLTRARLVAFYRKHAPEKEGNIDKIVDMYKDKFDVLDDKLKSKYGEGFNPAVKPKPVTRTTSKLLSTMNQGLGNAPKAAQGGVVKGDVGGGEETTTSKTGEIAVSVTAEEVLPILCWSKEAAAVRGEQHRRRRLSGSASGRLVPLKFYLVDSRSEDAAKEQGRFPTAVSLSPEAMLDPERIQQNVEMFESFRGAVHIVVMGEGFSALPELYNQKLSPKIETLMQEDVSKTNICALFFIKKGFPFVSILDGGFAKAHSWLVREGPSRHLDVSSVLVDYDPMASMFGQLESLQNPNASTTEKAQRRMQSLLEGSIVSMTRRAQQLERLASDIDEDRQGLRLKLFSRARSSDMKDDSFESKTDSKSSDTGKEKGESMFKNPFAAKNKSVVVQVDSANLDVASANAEPTTAKVSAEKTETEKKEESNTPNVGVRASLPNKNLARTSSSGSADAAPVPETAAPAAAPTVAALPPADSSTSVPAAVKSKDMVQKTAAARGESEGTSAAARDKTPVSNVLERNPFARFGGGGNKPSTQESQISKQAANTFAGLNRFRKNTMARMRKAGSFDDDHADAAAAEEAIDFG